MSHTGVVPDPTDATPPPRVPDRRREDKALTAIRDTLRSHEKRIGDASTVLRAMIEWQEEQILRQRRQDELQRALGLRKMTPEMLAAFAKMAELWVAFGRWWKLIAAVWGVIVVFLVPVLTGLIGKWLGISTGGSH